MQVLKKIKLSKNVRPVAAPAKPTDRKVMTNDAIKREQVDRSVSYCGSRIATAIIATKVVDAIGSKIPKLTEKGYLLVRGNKPGTLVRPVRYDSTSGIYATELNHYGSVAALNSQGLKADLFTQDELVQVAKKINHCVEVTHVETGLVHTVWLLNPAGDQYVAAIEVDKGTLRLHNMESPEPWNAPNPEVRYTNFKDVGGNSKAYFAKLK